MQNNDLISRKAVTEVLQKLSNEPAYQHTDEDFFCGISSAMCEIDEIPAVDAVILPCKVGDKVYRIDKGNYYNNWKPFVEELTVTEISWKKEKYGDKDLGFAIIANGIRYKFSSVGKSVFLTREEAESALAKMGRKDDT